jgi:hypothetical protein
MTSRPMLLLVLALSATTAHAESTVQRDQPTTRFYTADGKSAGSATTYSGGQTNIYAPDGKHIGTTVRADQPRRK